MKGVETANVQHEVATVLRDVATMKADLQAIRIEVADMIASHAMISKNLDDIIIRKEDVMIQ